jgi:hypothetical protein
MMSPLEGAFIREHGEDQVSPVQGPQAEHGTRAHIGPPSNSSVSSAEMRLISSGAEGSFGRLAMRPIIVPSMAGLGTRGGSRVLDRNGTNACQSEQYCV